MRILVHRKRRSLSLFSISISLSIPDTTVSCSFYVNNKITVLIYCNFKGRLLERAFINVCAFSRSFTVLDTGLALSIFHCLTDTIIKYDK